MTSPFDRAETYRAHGWSGVIALPNQRKAPPPDGFTGYGGRWPTPDDWKRWRGEGLGNIALRLPPMAIGLDVDAYGDKPGRPSLAGREVEWGQLPPTWWTTSRDDGASGIRLFRLPSGTAGGDSDCWPTEAAPGIEIIRYAHRYAVVSPSVHPEGRSYRWRRPDGRWTEDEIPRLSDLPELPVAWVEGLTGQHQDGTPGAKPGSRAEMHVHRQAAREWIRALPAGEPCRYVGRLAADALAAARREDGSAYDHVRDVVLALLRAGEAGHPGVREILASVREVYVDTVSDTRPEAIARGEFDRFTESGAAKVMASPSEPMGMGCDCAEGRLVRFSKGAQPSDAAGAVISPPSRPRQRIELIGADTLKRIPRPEYLIAGVLPRGSMGVLVSPPGGGKSFLALDWAACVATGRDWMGRPVAQGPVVYVVAEGATGMGIRVSVWEEVNEYPDLADLHFVTCPVQFMDSVEVNELEVALSSLPKPPSLLIIDTMARCLVGADENSSRDVGAFVAGIDYIRGLTGAAVLVVHHTGKAEGSRYRGSSALEGACDAMFALSGEPDRLQLECTKQKDDSPFVTMYLHLAPAFGSCVIEGEGSGATGGSNVSDRKLLLALRENFGATNTASASQWLKVSDVPEKTFYNARKRLVERGFVINTGTDSRPRYSITASGASELPPGILAAAEYCLPHATPLRGGSVAAVSPAAKLSALAAGVSFEGYVSPECARCSARTTSGSLSQGGFCPACLESAP